MRVVSLQAPSRCRLSGECRENTVRATLEMSLGDILSLIFAAETQVDMMEEKVRTDAGYGPEVRKRQEALLAGARKRVSILMAIKTLAL